MKAWIPWGHCPGSSSWRGRSRTWWASLWPRSLAVPCRSASDSWSPWLVSPAAGWLASSGTSRCSGRWSPLQQQSEETIFYGFEVWKLNKQNCSKSTLWVWPALKTLLKTKSAVLLPVWVTCAGGWDSVLWPLLGLVTRPPWAQGGCYWATWRQWSPGHRKINEHKI